MENGMKITPPEGWEIDIEKSSLQTGDIIYKVKEKKQLPKTWEELKHVKGYCIDTDSEILNIYDFIPINDENKNIVKTESQAKALLALCQLLYLRDEYNEGWIPDWTDDKIKYCIYTEGNILKKGVYYHIQKVISFKTAELHDEFFDNFKDLLETAKELL